jgi:hypothetical protein
MLVLLLAITCFIAGLQSFSLEEMQEKLEKTMAPNPKSNMTLINTLNSKTNIPHITPLNRETNMTLIIPPVQAVDHNSKVDETAKDSTINSPDIIYVGAKMRRTLRPTELDILKTLPIALDRPEHFKMELVYKNRPPKISEQLRQELIYRGHVAGVAYCNKEKVLDWTCGSRCRGAAKV